jgi:hypothetical protein
MNVKKAIVVIVIVAAVSFVAGTVLHAALDLGELFTPGTFLSRLIGTSPVNLGMKACLAGVLGAVFLVPSIRSEFTGSFSAGTEYKRGNKGSRGRSRI